MKTYIKHVKSQKKNKNIKRSDCVWFFSSKFLQFLSPSVLTITFRDKSIPGCRVTSEGYSMNEENDEKSI